MEQKKKRNWVGIGLLVSLLLAGLVFVLLVVLSNALTPKDDRVPVVVALYDIPANTMIYENQSNQFFTTKKVSKEFAYEGAYQSVSEMFQENNVYVTEVLRASEIVSQDSIIFSSPLSDAMKDPVAMGIKVSGFENAAGGILRRGDLVDLCTVDADGLEKSLQAYILQAFDNNGECISSNDHESVAVAFNLLIERDQYETVAEIVSSRQSFDLIKVNHVY